MALTKITSAGISDDAVTTDKLANAINAEREANTAKTTNATHSGEVTGATALTIADNIVDEANLKVSNSPTNGQFLSAQSGNTGGLTWATVDTDLVNDTSPQLGGDLDSNGNNIKITDGEELRVGDGNDMVLKHTGSTNQFQSESHRLIISGSASDNVDIMHTQSEYLASFIPNGAVELFHNNSKKFETNSTGVHVTGMVTCTTEFRCDDNEKFVAGTGQDLQIYHDGNDSYIDDAGVGSLLLRTTNNSTVAIQNSSANMARFLGGDAVELYHNNSKKFETNSSGVNVTGNVQLNDDYKSHYGNAQDLKIYHSSSDNNSYIEESGSGSLVVRANDFYLTDAGANHTQFLADSDADVKLSFNGTAKLQTTTDGAKVMGTGNFVLPSGTTAQRGSASTGAVRWNTTLGQLEVYNGTEWAGVGASSPQIYKVTNTTTNGAAGTSMVITGEDFVSGATVHYMGGNGTSVAAGSVAFNSSTQLTAVSPALLVAGAPYSIKVTNPDGGEAVAAPEIEVTAGNAPAWTTASGQLGSNQIKDVAVSGLTVAASDADGQAITYSETTSVLTSNANTPAATMNLSLNSSTGAITGTAPSVTSDTTYNFTLRATDTAGNTADRAFNIVVLAAPAAIKWFAGTGYGATGTRSGTTWSHTGYNPNASGGGNANNDRLRVYGNGTGGTYAGFHHFLYSNAITIPTGHDRCDIYISSIYTNNNGYRYNQGNTWTTSQPSGNSHGSGAFGARNMGSHGSGLQQYDVPSNHQGVTRYFQMFVFGGQNGVQYQEITLIKTYNQNNP